MLRQMFEESLARRTKEFGRNDAHTAQASRDLGLFLERNGDAASARRVLTDTIAIDDAVLGKTDPQTLEDVSALASVSPPALVAPLLRRVAESTDPAVAGPALSTLADQRSAAGDRVGAAAYLRRALEKAELVDGKDGPIVALLLNALALDVDPKEAVPDLERALQIDRAKLGDGDRNTQVTAVNLSQALAALARSTRAKGDKVEAERLYRQALQLAQAVLGPNDARTRTDARELGAVLRVNGKTAEAVTLERTYQK
jgi:tetratricopeptide (TPR) repeat protein